MYIRCTYKIQILQNKELQRIKGSFFGDRFSRARLFNKKNILMYILYMHILIFLYVSNYKTDKII